MKKIANKREIDKNNNDKKKNVLKLIMFNRNNVHITDYINIYISAVYVSKT